MWTRIGRTLGGPVVDATIDIINKDIHHKVNEDNKKKAEKEKKERENKQKATEHSASGTRRERFYSEHYKYHLLPPSETQSIPVIPLVVGAIVLVLLLSD